MKSTDPRDKLFAELHESYLRQLGYRRRGRKSTLDVSNGLFVVAELESSTWNTTDRIEFGINLGVMHPNFARDPFTERERERERKSVGDVLVMIGLRRYTDPPNHRWSVTPEGDNEGEFSKVRAALAGKGVELLLRMNDFSKLESLCGEFGPFRYFEARSWCLRRLGRVAEAAEVIRAALSAAPHPGAAEHAARLLARHDA
jgi:hypothetical protein